MPNVILKEQTFDRHDKGANLALRFLPPVPLNGQGTDRQDKRLWFKCVPDTSGVQAATAFSVIQIVSVTLDSNLQPLIRYKRPDADSVLNTAITWGNDIPDGSVSGAFGWCTFEPAFVKYNTAGTPALDEDWGTEANTFQLKEGNMGYKVLGATGSGRVLVRKPDSGSTIVRFELDATLDLGSFAAATVVTLVAGTYDNVGAAITVKDFTTPGSWKGVTGQQGIAWKPNDNAAQYEILFLEDNSVQLEAGNNPGHLKDNLQIWNAAAEYVTSKDIDVDFEAAGTAPTKKARPFIDSNAISGHNNGGPRQFLSKAATTDFIEWVTYAVLVNGTAPWITVAQVGDTFTVSHAGPKGSGETVTTVGAAAEGTGSADTGFWDADATTNAGEGYVVSRIYHNEATPGSPVEVFYRKARWDSLGHWVVYGPESSGVNIGLKDRLVAVDVSQTEVFLESALSDLATTGVVFGIDFTKVGATPDKTINAKIDTSLISGYSPTTFQNLSHDTAGAFIWQAPAVADDRFVAVEASQTPNFLSAVLVDLAHSGMSLGIDVQVIGTTPNKQMNAKSDLSLLSDFTSGTAELMAHTTSDGLNWLAPEAPWLSIGSGLLVHGGPKGSGETVTTVGAAAEGSVGADTGSYDATGTANAGEVYVVSRVVLDSSTFYTYFRKIRCDSLGHTVLYGAETEVNIGSVSADDKFVAVETGQTPDYLSGVLVDLAHSGMSLGIDFQVIGTTPNKDMNAKADLSTLTGFSTGVAELMAHNGSDTLDWLAPDGIWLSIGSGQLNHVGPRGSGETVTTVGAAAEGSIGADTGNWDATGTGNAGEVYVVSRVVLDSGTLYAYWRKIRCDSVGHNVVFGPETEGNLGAITAEDKFVAVEASQTPNFLSAVLVDKATTGVLFGVDMVVTGTTPNKLMHGQIDTATISGYSAGTEQTLGHDTGGNFIWLVDKYVAVESGNTPGYLFDQFADVNTSATYTAAEDFLVEIERTGSAPNKDLRCYIDTSDIPNYESTEPQFFGKDTSDDLEMQVFTGDGFWVSVAYSAGTWTASHTGPRNEGAGTTVGQSAPSGTDLTADTDSFTGTGSNWLQLNLCSRVAYDTTNKKFVQFTRQIKTDRKGHIYSVSAETGPTDIIDLVNCTTV